MLMMASASIFTSTSASDTVAIGSTSMFTSDSTSASLAIGSASMGSSTSTSDSLAIGSASMSSSASAPDGVAVGLATITSGILFEKLPGEIRNRIYKFVFVKAGNIGSCSKRVTVAAKAFHAEAVSYLNVNFLLSCKSVYQESANIFYACNSFEFQKVSVLEEFLASIGIENRKKLTRLRFLHFLAPSATWAFGAGLTTHKALRYLRSCSQLKSLQIYACCRPLNGKRCWLAYPLKDALEVLRGVQRDFKWGHARVFGTIAALASGLPLRCPRLPRDAVVEALTNVHKELEGKPFAHLPKIFTGEPRAWRFSGYKKRKLEQMRSLDECIMNYVQLNQPGLSSSVLASSTESLQPSSDQGQDSNVHEDNADLANYDQPSSWSPVLESDTADIQIQDAIEGYHQRPNDILWNDNLEYNAFIAGPSDTSAGTVMPVLWADSPSEQSEHSEEDDAEVNFEDWIDFDGLVEEENDV